MPRPAGARCFISYSHTPRDEAALRYLVGVLARWGLQPWWDGNLVATSGVALNREVAAAIEQADVVLVLLSSQSAASMYCLGEVGYCLERSKRIVRIDVEPVATPAGLLPLSAARGVVWHGVTQGQAEADLARALTAEGIVLDLSGIAGSAGSSSDQLFLDDPDNATIRPRYSQLLAAGPDRAREYALRLARAGAANPANGFNALSLALVWLYIGDGQRALACAQVATATMPQSSDAHYAEALALCMTRALDARTRAEVEDILRRLVWRDNQDGNRVNQGENPLTVGCEDDCRWPAEWQALIDAQRQSPVEAERQSAAFSSSFGVECAGGRPRPRLRSRATLRR